EKIFNDYARGAGIKILFQHRIIKAAKKNGFLKEIIIEHSGTSALTKRKIAARMFIDCSYEGDLMARAGVTYTVGRESNSIYNETYNGVQLMDRHQFPDGIDPYKIPGDPGSGLLWGISNTRLEPNGTGDKKVQAYNYRICLTNDAGNRLTIDRPDGYDSSKYELLIRLFASQPDKKTLNDYFIFSKMPNSKTDINNRGGFSTDMIGMNHDYPEAGYAERAKIIKEHEAYTKGLLYFYANDKRVPAELRNEMKQWGYPKDEYADNGHWSPQLYIRECRRMIGSYVMTQANCQGRELVNDGIAMAAYTMDSHNCQRIVVNDMVKNEGNVEIGGFGPYPISYRSIIPKENECGNLIVPVCLSASHIAYGSIRMEPVFMALAQSAAVAACMAIDNKQPVQQVDVKKIQEFLKSNPLMDKSTPEILVDNEDKECVNVEGTWQRKTSEPEHGYVGNYGPSMLIGDHVSEKQVKFVPVIKESGKYRLYAYVPKVPGGAGQTHYIVYDGKNSKEIFINSSSIRVEGQTSGEWTSLGIFSLPKGTQSFVAVTNKGANGTIIADAVLFVPLKDSF
ncbi:MAG TPA: FAD-dependent oxidoreductase, partial [Chitinophagaceae bacterium]|nr:FAD-dependent oxidoreductase [Chitinophagaceae bacterium]